MKISPIKQREREKQKCWTEDVTVIINRARALAKYRGQDMDRIFTLKMELANAVAEYDSKPNRI